MARDFNGTSAIINLGQPAALNFTGAFTISAWVVNDTFPALGTNYQVIFAKGYDGAKEQYVLRYGGTIPSGNALSLDISYFDGAAQHGAQWTPYTNVTGTWYNVVGGFDGSSWFLYNNGTLVGATFGTQIVPVSVNADVSIGGEYLSSIAGRFFDGRIAEVGVWNVGLTAGEIGALARGVSPLLVRPASLVEYQPLVRENISYKRAAPTITGTTIVPHPRVLMPRPRPGQLLHTAAAPTFLAARAKGSNLPVLGTGTF